jgi:uncharacterized membrane protein
MSFSFSVIIILSVIILGVVVLLINNGDNGCLQED